MEWGFHGIAAEDADGGIDIARVATKKSDLLTPVPHFVIPHTAVGREARMPKRRERKALSEAAEPGSAEEV